MSTRQIQGTKHGGWRRVPQRGALLLLVLSAMVAVLQGCTVDDISVVSYTSSAEVKPPQTQAPAVVRSSPFPWDIVLSGASDILTGARKKAIEEKVGYRESRSLTLFRLKRAHSWRDCGQKCNPTQAANAALNVKPLDEARQGPHPDHRTENNNARETRK